MDEHDQLRGLSDDLLTDADRLQETEQVRRQVPPGTPGFEELSEAEHELAEDMTRKAVASTELGKQLGKDRS